MRLKITRWDLLAASAGSRPGKTHSPAIGGVDLDAVGECSASSNRESKDESDDMLMPSNLGSSLHV